MSENASLGKKIVLLPRRKGAKYFREQGENSKLEIRNKFKMAKRKTSKMIQTGRAGLTVLNFLNFELFGCGLFRILIQGGPYIRKTNDLIVTGTVPEGSRILPRSMKSKSCSVTPSRQSIGLSMARSSLRMVPTNPAKSWSKIK